MDSIAIDREEGPSWARANWPLASLDAVNQGLDPTEATIEQVAAAASKAATATGADPEAVRKAADDSIRAMMLIRSFRVRGPPCCQARSARPCPFYRSSGTPAGVSWLH
jgi:2-oxoglutarate dehydrogenase E1 component